MLDSSVAARIRSFFREMFTIDLRTLAVFRIGLGSILLLDLLLRSRFFFDLYVEGGASLPAQPPAAFFSLHGLSLAPGFQAALFLLAGTLAGMLLAGYRTRLATIGSWVLLISLQDAWFDFGDGGDSFLRALLLWSIFLPLGARFSIDAHRSQQSVAAAPVYSLASAALLLQFVFVYFFAGIGKSGAEWSNGLALELALSNEYWTNPAGKLLLGYPDILRVLTPIVLWFEILGPLVMLFTFRSGLSRLLTMASFWGFQLGLAVNIHLNIFPLISTVATLPFLPLWFWNELERRRGRSVTQPPPAPQAWLSPVWQVVVGTLLIFVFVSNLESRSIVPQPLSGSSADLACKLGIDQNWDMYARPPIDDFSFDYQFIPVAGCTLEQSDPGRERRQMIEHLAGAYRFKYYIERALDRPRGPERVERYLTWACREWNAGLPTDRRLERIVLSVDTRTMLYGGRPPRHILLRDHKCEATNP